MRKAIPFILSFICFLSLGVQSALADGAPKQMRSPAAAAQVHTDLEHACLWVEVETREPVEIRVISSDAPSNVVRYASSASGKVKSICVPLADFGYAFGRYGICVYRTRVGEEPDFLQLLTTIVSPPSTESFHIQENDGTLRIHLEASTLSSEIPVWAQFWPADAPEQKVLVCMEAQEDAWQAAVPLSGMTSGRYDGAAYCGSREKGGVRISTCTFEIDGVRNASMQVETGSSAGVFNVTAKAKAPSEIEDVLAAVWTKADQSDIRWYELVSDGKEWKARVDIADFEHRMGTYHVHLWATMGNGVRTLLDGQDAWIWFDDYLRLEKRGRFCLVHLAPSPDEPLRVASWSENGGQQDLQWVEAVLSSEGSNTASISLRRFTDAGNCLVHVYRGEECVGQAAFQVSIHELESAKELRGMWVPSVYNLDFPTRYGAEIQKAEFREIVRNARDWNFNALFVQVRPHADALYASQLQPWSEVLTGKNDGDPGYDPLAFMIETAHAAGIELHAWLNPYRVGTPSQISTLSTRSVAKQHPDWLLWHGQYGFLDPERPEVRSHICATVQEIVSQYDVDGIHFDDYFYPYGYPLPAGESRDGLVGNTRRRCVTEMVRMVSEVCHAADVEFGISPFGVWKNSSSDPRGSATQSEESYYANYCDTITWMEEGLLDYIAPQLYWTMSASDSSYSVLLDWWAQMAEQTDVQLLVGQGIYKEEITQEIEQQLILNTNYSAYAGSIFYRYGDIAANDELSERLARWNGQERF